MSGFFGVAAKEDCVFDLFFGIDYHSHLGTRRAGMVVYGDGGYNRAIHNIENSPFRTKFDKDFRDMKGNLGIGCISDYEPQPLLIRSHHGTFALATVGKINNIDEIIEMLFQDGTVHFQEMSTGEVNPTELIAAVISQKENLIDGIEHALTIVDGSLSLIILTSKGIYAARDKHGRTPVVIGKKDGAMCVSFEDFAYHNLGYQDFKQLAPGEIAVITPDSAKVLACCGKEMKICTFLWVYYGYPASSYEGVSVEQMRYNCGQKLAQRDTVKPDTVAGVPDSGLAHAIGYSNESGIPFSRPFVKYTPTWARSFTPTVQSKRNLIAKMKLLAVNSMIKDKSLLMIDDSIVRGTQLRETTDFLYESGATEVHIRPACPPLVYGCKYLNFSRSNSEMDLITRKKIAMLEGVEDTSVLSEETLSQYCHPENPKYEAMVEEIRKELNFTSLRFSRLDDMLEAVGIDPCKLCTYCWNGKE